MNAQLRSFNALLKVRGLTRGQVAAAAGLTVDSLEEQLWGRVNFHRRARKIEVALNAPIWTEQDEWERLNEAARRLGADPVLAGFHKLRCRCIALNTPDARRLTNRADLVASVLAIDFPNPSPS